MTRRFLFAILAAMTFVVAQARASTKDYLRTDSIAELIIRAEMEHHPQAWQIDGQQTPKWNYTQGLELMGMRRWQEVLGMEDAITAYTRSYTDTLIRPDGTIVRYKPTDYKLDGINSGKLLFSLYTQTGEARYLNAIRLLRQQLHDSPRVEGGGFWHKRIYTQQMWLDGLYMGTPFYAQYAATYEQDARRDSSFRDIVRQFTLIYEHTWCEDCHLLHHGWDATHKQSWSNPENGRSAHAWGRAEGWYLMALVDVLEWLPQPYQQPLVDQLQTLCASLLPLQTANGCWLQVLDCPDAEGNYEEMSVTPMIAYAMMKGYRMGWLSRPYLTAGMRATESICHNYLKIRPGQQRPSLTQICQVAGLSDDRDGSLTYYLGEKIVDDDPKGIGPLLLALWEYPSRRQTVRPSNASHLLHAIECANTLNRETNYRQAVIHLPAGTYDLGQRTLTRISGHHISLEGEGMTQTIIRNQPPVDKEGISRTATLLNTSRGLRLCDLTLENALDYYSAGAAGRAVCLQDKGDSTLCRRIRMLSYQDTYYSNNPRAHHLFAESEIHGTVDFICGDGDVVFDHCTLVCEPRYANGKGSCTITAPRTTEGADGYLFWYCTIESRGSTYNLGRAWGGMPQCYYVHTTLAQPELLLPERFSRRGMNVCVADFLEYNTLSADGKSISPRSKITTITRGDEQDTRQRIMTRRQAKNLATRVKATRRAFLGR